MLSWRLTGLELAALREDMRESGLPQPFGLTCRIPLYSDYLRAKKAARDNVRARLGGGFEEVLDVIAKPDIRIVVNGVDAAAEETRSRVRLHAARRADRAYLLRQQTDEPDTAGGIFTVDECGVLELGAAVVDRLPDGPAGTRGTIDLSSHGAVDTDYEYGQSMVRESAEDPSWWNAERFLRMPVTGIGYIAVGQGVSRFGPRHAVEQVLQWRDVEDDGRYVLVDGSHPMAVGVARQGLTDRINSVIADVVRVIKDERR